MVKQQELLRTRWFYAHFLKEHRFYGGHGIVGGQIPLEQVLHLQISILKEVELPFVVFGDGAVRQGALHETF